MNAETRSTQDERIMAALAHGAVLLPMWGLILTGVIWATQREKSEYVRQQGVQALAWQVTELVGMFIGMGCYFISFFFGFFAIALTERMGSAPFFFPVFPLLSFGFIFLLIIFFMVVGLIAAVQSLQGRPFTYPFVGRRVRAYLADSPGEVNDTAA